MKTIEVTLTNQTEDLILLFNLYDIPIAHRWFDLLSEVTNDPKFYIREKDRFHNFPNGETLEDICDRINNCIEIINSYHPSSIPIHKHFELYRGGVLTPSKMYDKGDLDLRDTISDYNELIHRLEYKIRGRPPEIVIPFEPLYRLPLKESDYQSFNLRREFGEISINYCEVGKQILDVFVDEDDIVGEDNIRPLRYYAADMTLYFGERDLSIYWDEIKKWLIKGGYDPLDKTLALGTINVGILQYFSHDNPNEIIDQISQYSEVKMVKVGD